MNKVVRFEKLPDLIKKLKQSSQPVVLVGGCFDILHLGHIRFLKKAKKYGTVVVLLENDQSLQEHKGLHRPIHKQEERAEVLSTLESVDYILLLPHFTTDEEYSQLTKTISPSYIIYTEGDTQKENKTKQAKKVGAKLIEVPKISTPSTTQLAKLLHLE